MEILGIGRDEQRVYQELVTTLDTDPSTLARRLEMPVSTIIEAVRTLRGLGLVRPGHGSSDPAGAVPDEVGSLVRDNVTPTPPDVSLGRLLSERQHQLDQAQSTVSELRERYYDSVRRRDAPQLVEVVTGREAIREQVRALQLGTREEIVWFCKAGYVAMPSAENTEEFTMLDRGVRFRVLYEQALLEEPGILDSVRHGVAAGEQARAVPELPIRLAIADRELALCPLVPLAESHGQPSAALIRESTLLTALIALFENFWERGSPLYGPASEQGFADDDRELLALLVAGVTDKAIAHRLSISQRTVQRRVADLLRRAGAQTRAQLAWQAARLGWLDTA